MLLVHQRFLVQVFSHCALCCQSRGFHPLCAIDYLFVFFLLLIITSTSTRNILLSCSSPTSPPSFPPKCHQPDKPAPNYTRLSSHQTHQVPTKQPENHFPHPQKPTPPTPSWLLGTPATRKPAHTATRSSQTSSATWQHIMILLFSYDALTARALSSCVGLMTDTCTTLTASPFRILLNLRLLRLRLTTRTPLPLRLLMTIRPLLMMAPHMGVFIHASFAGASSLVPLLMSLMLIFSVSILVRSWLMLVDVVVVD